MSNLIRHTEEEMRRAGLYDSDSDYGGMIPRAVMKLVHALASEGHSGSSHYLTMKIFNRVANFKTLTPVTNDPTEWMEVSDMCPIEQRTVFQSKREPSTFSNDGGKTHYSIDDPKRIVRPSTDFKSHP